MGCDAPSTETATPTEGDTARSSGVIVLDASAVTGEVTAHVTCPEGSAGDRTPGEVVEDGPGGVTCRSRSASCTAAMSTTTRSASSMPTVPTNV